MANTIDLLGALLQRGMTDSSTERIKHSLSDRGIGGQAGILEQELGIQPARRHATAEASARERAASSEPSAGGLGGLAEIAKSMFGEENRGKSLATGGLGALAGAILGAGGDKSAKGAVGGGALALLGSIALQALRRASEQGGEQRELDPATKLAAGLREPQDAREADQVRSIADLTVKAMVNAAKADGRIDEDEMQKVVGELQEDGITQKERDYLLSELRKPADTAEIVRSVPNRQVAAQVYAASLLAIEVDTPSEREYLRQLARDLELNPRIVERIHETLGLA